MNKTLLRGIAFLTVIVSLSAFAQKSTMVTTKVLDAATNAIMQSVSSGDTATLNSAKGYTDTATNGLMTAVEGKGYLTEHQSLSAYSTTEQMNEELEKKQDSMTEAEEENIRDIVRNWTPDGEPEPEPEPEEEEEESGE